jgi:hypothetical protein
VKTQNSGGTPQGPEARIVIDNRGGGFRSRMARLVMGVAAIVAFVLFASAVHWLPQLRNPFSETTTDRSQPVILKSIVELHQYEAASGEFSVVVDVTKSSWLPSFLQGSDTVFVGIGTARSFVDFSGLGPSSVSVSADRLSATINLPHSQVEAANLDVKQSYVLGTQQGLLDSLGNLFGGDPNSQQQFYVMATDKISAAAKQSELAADAERNTRAMLEGLLHSLGFTNVTVNFGPQPAPSTQGTATPAPATHPATTH